jgi:hypothetical protein
LRSDRVVEVAVRLRLVDERDDVGNLELVEVLVLEALVEPLDDAVGLGRAVAGPDVGQFGPTRDEAQEVSALVGLAVVGDDQGLLSLAQGALAKAIRPGLGHRAMHHEQIVSTDIQNAVLKKMKVYRDDSAASYLEVRKGLYK